MTNNQLATRRVATTQPRRRARYESGVRSSVLQTIRVCARSACSAANGECQPASELRIDRNAEQRADAYRSPLVAATGRAFVAGALLLLAVSGCAPQEIDQVYGKRRGVDGGRSVNGTAVLSGMFAEAGHAVRSWRRLSPKLEESQIIVWAPDDFEPPVVEHREFLERWLSNEDHRTLIYIGRDYDAAIAYWRHAEAPAEQAVEAARRLAMAQSQYEFARSAVANDKHHDWFTLRRDSQTREIQVLEGPWADGIDAARTDIELATQFAVPGKKEIDAWLERDESPWIDPPEFDSLLTAQGKELVTRISFDNGSRILVVSNGSFLLNLPLVNHEHRKLAGKLISACAPPRRVVFLESEAGGPLVLDEDPNANYPTGLEIFTAWPLGIIVLHLAAVGILFCIAVFPIFGRAHQLDRVSPSDFGKHIIALGELLALTRDRQYAVDCVRYYYEHVRRDSGLSHRRDNTSTSSPTTKLTQPATAEKNSVNDES